MKHFMIVATFVACSLGRECIFLDRSGRGGRELFL